MVVAFCDVTDMSGGAAHGVYQAGLCISADVNEKDFPVLSCANRVKSCAVFFFKPCKQIRSCKSLVPQGAKASRVLACSRGHRI